MKVALVSPDDLSSVLFCKEIILLLRDHYKADVYVLGDVYDRIGCYAETIRSWGVRFVPIKMERYIDPVKDLKFFESMRRFFGEKRVQAVITNCTKPNIYGPMAAKCAGVGNVLCSFWGKGAVFGGRNGLRGGILKGTLLSLYYCAFRSSSMVWFTNHSDYDYFLRNRIVKKAKSIVTKNYVDTEDYRPDGVPMERIAELRQEFGLRDGDAVVIMVGRLVWAKGVREFVEASKLLKERLPFVKFIFVGPKDDGALDGVPESYLRENEINANFVWTGFRKDVKDLYALADLAVLPSYYKEGGFPRGLIEPMAMGKPVIAADTEECRGPVEDGKNGYLVPVKDPEALAKAIEGIMLNRQMKEDFGLYSRLKAVRDFDEKVIVGKVLEAFMSSLS